MPQFRAAILSGPRGPFAVVELTAAQQRRLSADDRRQLTACVRQRHGSIAVVFVTASPSTLNAIHGQEMDAEVLNCLSTHEVAKVPWETLDHPAGDAAATGA